MKPIEKSIFSLIEIFKGRKTVAVQSAISHNHCEQRHHHDFYCDAEKPFIPS